MKKIILFAAILASAVLPQLAPAYQDCCFEEPDCCSSFDLQGLYVGVTGGASFPNIERHHNNSMRTDTGYFVSGSVGYRWCYGFRTEAEVGYHRACLRSRFSGFDDISEGDGYRYRNRGHLSSISYMANIYYDLPVCFWVTPYVGGGIGYAQNRISLSNRDDSGDRFGRRRNGFAWQVIAGLNYEINCNWSAAVEYRYYQPRSHHSGGSDYREYSRHRTAFNDVNLNLKYNF